VQFLWAPETIIREGIDVYFFFVQINKAIKMSKLNTLTCLVSAGYPVWYSFGVSRGCIDVRDGLRTDLLSVSGAGGTGYKSLIIEFEYYLENDKVSDAINLNSKKINEFLITKPNTVDEIKRLLSAQSTVSDICNDAKKKMKKILTRKLTNLFASSAKCMT
jgi:hypothetical protein